MVPQVGLEWPKNVSIIIHKISLKPLKSVGLKLPSKLTNKIADWNLIFVSDSPQIGGYIFEIVPKCLGGAHKIKPSKICTNVHHSLLKLY